MPTHGSVRTNTAGPGLYGPNNPPPPPASPPPQVHRSQRPPEDSSGQSKKNRHRPSKSQRMRTYNQGEAAWISDKRDRSRSPDRNYQRPDHHRYRERSPIQRDRPAHSEHVKLSNNDPEPVVDASGVRCYACNGRGHLAVDCKPEEASDRAQDRRSRSQLRSVEPRRSNEERHWSPEEEINAVSQYRPAEMNGCSHYRNGSMYGTEHETRPFHDVYRPTQDRPQMSRTGYDDYQEIDWNRRVSSSDPKSMSRHEHPSRLPATQKPRAVGHGYKTQPESQKAQKLGLPHLVAAKDIQTPPTVYDLRVYDTRISETYSKLPKGERFENGINGKVAPSIYGSMSCHDLGLCFATFLTRKSCEMGLGCPWRHHPLSIAEKIWIIEYGKTRGKEFLGNVERCYTTPQMPVPGANMHHVAEK
ncbi:hypothetical protein Ptr902_10362 [Pyrenophora tritici-repentis]|nr:hypothetical protein Ptr902_10362 [Pyrenophora tritici-repentis]